MKGAQPMQTPPTADNTEPRPRQRRSLPAVLLLSMPHSLLIANVVILTVIVDALLWYHWAVTQDPGWLFAAGVLSLLALTVLLNLHRLRPRRSPHRRMPPSSSSRHPPPPPR